jgi:hypothetical protein
MYILLLTQSIWSSITQSESFEFLGELGTHPNVFLGMKSTFRKNHDNERQHHQRKAVLDDTGCHWGEKRFSTTTANGGISWVVQNSRSSDPQAVVGRVSRREKKNLIDRIIGNMVKNHHPVIEERSVCSLVVQDQGSGLSMETIMASSNLTSSLYLYHLYKMMVSKFQRSDIDIQKAVNAWCQDPAKATAANGTHHWLPIWRSYLIGRESLMMTLSSGT